jgi:heterodisulfide reductase subunit A
MENREKVPLVLVVGGGIAGLQSSLDLAEMGINVYLLEEIPFLGGTASYLDKVYPDNRSARDIILSLISSAREHQNISIISNAQLEELEKKGAAFQAVINKAPFRVTESCNLCGTCLQVCPVKSYNRFNEGLSLRTAIDLENRSTYPAICSIEKEIPACQIACPVHVDIRRYVGLIADGKFDEALAVIRQSNPLPAICGRVCTHPCETACNRALVDEPIAIDALKGFAAEYELRLRKEGKISLPEPVNKNGLGKVAVIGCGPAGLTCSSDLANLGYEVTIFEKELVPGGMLWLGIPEFRLPRELIMADIDYIKALGVEIKLNTPIMSDLTLDDLFQQGYKAIFIAIGAYKGKKLGAPGEDEYEGFIDSIEFLKRVNLGDKSKPGSKVIVIGGGNSAIDASRVSLRLGCEEVYILYRRSRKEMPANESEIEEAEHEGVKIHYLAAPIRILGKDGKVSGMECTRMELGKLDASGRRRPIPIKGSEFTIECDLIIPAISQEPDLSFFPEKHGLEISKWNSFVVDEKTLATNRPGIFAGGDAVTGPATVIEAISAGHRAACSIDNYIKDLSK